MPSRFYSIAPLVPSFSVDSAIQFYCDKLGFRLLHRDGEPAKFASIERDGVQIYLYDTQDKHLAEWSSLRIKVDEIDELYAHCLSQGIVHPNGSLGTRPWGTREFVILDPSAVCITFVQSDQAGAERID